MKDIFKKGDVKEYRMTVQHGDVAAFHGTVVHEVCSTFTLTREAEWTTRQFVLEMREEDEEGIGTFVTVNHRAPAFVGETIVFTGKIDEINGHELICSFEGRVGDRLIAEGKTGQKIFKKEKLIKLFSSVKKA
jgi:fluoroacetyl-CoA thioesterase